MKILWLDLNSSYAHASLALPALHAQQDTASPTEWEVVSATINENPGPVVEQIHDRQPDIVAATAWLFNHETLLAHCRQGQSFASLIVVWFGRPRISG